MYSGFHGNLGQCTAPACKGPRRFSSDGSVHPPILQMSPLEKVKSRDSIFFWYKAGGVRGEGQRGCSSFSSFLSFHLTAAFVHVSPISAWHNSLCWWFAGGVAGNELLPCSTRNSHFYSFLNWLCGWTTNSSTNVEPALIWWAFISIWPQQLQKWTKKQVLTEAKGKHQHSISKICL